MPKVTVLMTVYNGERHLRECMDSVLSQSFKDFEFLIIDDRSVDASMDIIRSYNDNRIRIIENQRNLGQVRSLNIGLDLARGEYVARMDQDDVMMKNRLKRQSGFLDKRAEVAVVGTWCKTIDEKGRVFDISRFPTVNEEIVGHVLFGGYFLAHPSATFRKDVVIDAGKYNESLSYAEDYDLWTRLLLKKYKLANIPEFLTKFRYHRESSSRRFPETQLKNARTSISNFVKIISGPYDDSDLDRLCDILINAGTVKGEYWLDEANILCMGERIDLLEALLSKTAAYFNFKKREIYSARRVFCKRMLNFAYQASGRAKKKSMPLYLFCLRNYMYLFVSPKLYLYPIKAAL